MCVCIYIYILIYIRIHTYTHISDFRNNSWILDAVKIARATVAVSKCRHHHATAICIDVLSDARYTHTLYFISIGSHADKHRLLSSLSCIAQV